jgi:hypothetical protein
MLMKHIRKLMLSSSPHKLTFELSKSLRNQASRTCTMKYILFYLHMLSLGAVCGAEIV